MLTARPALAARRPPTRSRPSLEREPDWSAIRRRRRRTSGGCSNAVSRKDPKRRLRDIAIARLEIEEAWSPCSPGGGSRGGRILPPRWPRLVRWARGGGGVLCWSSGAARVGMQRSEYFWRNPLEGANFTRLTDFEGAEHHAAISRDGSSSRFSPTARRLGRVGQPGRDRRRPQPHQWQRAELRNPATRTLGFSPDGSLVTIWSRVSDPAGGGLVDAGWAVPTMGGPLRPVPERHLRARLVARRRDASSTTRPRRAIRCSSPSRREGRAPDLRARGRACTTTFPSGRTTARSSTSSRDFRWTRWKSGAIRPPGASRRG
jgi:hypothetical protein